MGKVQNTQKVQNYSLLLLIISETITLKQYGISYHDMCLEKIKTQQKPETKQDHIINIYQGSSGKALRSCLTCSVQPQD